MSRFKLIDGVASPAVDARTRDIRELELQISKNLRPTDRDHVVYAHHFVRLKHPLLACKYLNRVNRGYFASGIYRDLFQAMLAWSITSQNPVFRSSKYARAYEYFIIAKKIAADPSGTFDELDFASKDELRTFKRGFNELSRFSNFT